MAAAAAAKVVHRCDAAKETGQLDLSECELRQVPSCLYLLMKETKVKRCDFSQNVIKKLPTKFGQEFTRITAVRETTDLLVFDLHHNQLSTLPDTLSCCCHLEHLDLSHNSLEFVPDVIYSFQHLQTLNLSNNRITDFEMGKLKDLPALKEIDLSNNDFNEELKGRLQTINHMSVKL